MSLSSLFRRATPERPSGRGESSSTCAVDSQSPASVAPPTRARTALDATGFVKYAWLLDPKKQIIGYRMAWQARAEHRQASERVRLQALISAVAQGFVHRSRGWLMGKTGLMFDVTPASVQAADWMGIPAKNVVLCWQGHDMADPEVLPLLKALRELGFGHMLCGDVPENKEVCALVTHFDVGAGEPLAMASSRSIGGRPARPVASRMQTWATFDTCATQRVPVIVSPTQEPPAVAGPAAMQPEMMLIVRVLQMVQRNEDIRLIETALKHDAALTYRFLHHINSPAVGAGVEIESLRHAVAMLGYSRLFRWLSILLTTADAKSRPPFLMKKAIIRGRFMELLGQALLGPQHADNLFLVGMFSLIAGLLGITMTELLEKVQLADSVQTAITEKGGMYGPFLALALACEAGSEEADALTAQLLMSATQVNAAHLGAIAWAQEISRSDVAY